MFKFIVAVLFVLLLALRLGIAHFLDSMSPHLGWMPYAGLALCTFLIWCKFFRDSQQRRFSSKPTPKPSFAGSLFEFLFF